VLGHAGNAQAGSRAGQASGGSQSAGSGGTAGDAGGPSAGEGGSAGESPSGPFRAVVGSMCPLESTIGVVELWRGSPSSVQVSLYDGPDPWLTEPELSTATCDYYHYQPLGCSGCPTGQVCSAKDGCVPERRTIKDASLQVRFHGEQRQYDADPQLGGIYGMLDIGDQYSFFGMTLRWQDTQIELDPMPVPQGDIKGLAVTTESRQSNKPGALDAIWDPPGDEAMLRTRIPINHHAGGPTFTECRAFTSAGAFHADADMIDPLAVATGLEFQRMEHVYVAAAQTPRGCVEFRFGTAIYVLPNDPPT
jgi:hypothetical protein